MLTLALLLDANRLMKLKSFKEKRRKRIIKQTIAHQNGTWRLRFYYNKVGLSKIYQHKTLFFGGN